MNHLTNLIKWLCRIYLSIGFKYLYMTLHHHNKGGVILNDKKKKKKKKKKKNFKKIRNDPYFSFLNGEYLIYYDFWIETLHVFIRIMIFNFPQKLILETLGYLLNSLFFLYVIFYVFIFFICYFKGHMPQYY